MMNIDSIYDKNADRKWDKLHRFETKLRTAIRHTRRGRVNRRVARIVKTVGYRIHENDNASDGSCSEVEPDSGVDVEIDADAQCAVCLDVYCMPRRCAPCGHSFCGWCLRSLAHSTTSYCDEGYLCPLCRAKIVWTEEDQVCQQDVKSRYPSLLRQRMTAYRKQRRRHRWPLPEGTKCDQFLLAASMRLPRSRCILFAVILLALLFYFNSALIHQKAD
uniref:RING-type domain-containing protein n=1 Tax=Plectus sambesii TaxID=2011161 RepID=A0A914V0T8_9BILA